MKIAPPATEPLLSPKEVAEILKVTRRTVHRMTSRGELPQPRRFNHQVVRWTKTQIDKAIASRQN